MRIRIWAVALLIPAAHAAGQVRSFLDSSSVPGDTAVENIVFRLVNEERAKTGVAPLVSDHGLVSAARQHANEMAARHYFGHLSPVPGLTHPGDRVYAAGLTDCAVGENIAVHSLDGAADAIAEKFLAQWMASPPHRDNILSQDFDAIGIGVVSLRDSVIKDTIIDGRRHSYVDRTIRHFATQNFSDRTLVFERLAIIWKTLPFRTMAMEIDLDRDVIAAVGNTRRRFHPTGCRVLVRWRVPREAGAAVTLAYVHNAYKNEYVRFCEFPLDASKPAGTSTAPCMYPVRVQDLPDTVCRAPFLIGRAMPLDDDTGGPWSIVLGDDGIVTPVSDAGSLSFEIPLTGTEDTLQVAWVLENQPVKHRILIDVRALNGGTEFPDVPSSQVLFCKPRP